MSGLTLGELLDTAQAAAAEGAREVTVHLPDWSVGVLLDCCLDEVAGRPVLRLEVGK